MNKRLVLFCVLMLIPMICSASDSSVKKRGIFSGIAHLEGRGLSNVFLFPAEWGHLPKDEVMGAWGAPFVGLTHMGGRIFSGVGDIVVLPLFYPFSKYDDSLPVNMGWGEFPWQKGNGN